MSTSVRWVADRRRPARARTRTRRIIGVAQSLITLLLGVIVVAAVAIILRGIPATGPSLTGLTAGANDVAPEQLTAAAADALEDTTKAGGSGYRFEIVQTSTMVAKAAGPKIPIPDPVTRGTLRMADTYYLNALLERGVGGAGLEPATPSV